MTPDIAALIERLTDAKNYSSSTLRIILFHDTIAALTRLAAAQDNDTGWVLIERSVGGRDRTVGIALTHAAKDAFMRASLDVGESRSALAYKVFPAPPETGR